MRSPARTHVTQQCGGFRRDCRTMQCWIAFLLEEPDRSNAVVLSCDWRLLMASSSFQPTGVGYLAALPARGAQLCRVLLCSSVWHPATVSLA